MTLVEVHKLSKQAVDESQGIIFIDGEGHLKCHPKDNQVLQHLLSETVRRYPYSEAGRQGVTASEPEVFLESLHHQYQSPYLRVGPVRK